MGRIIEYEIKRLKNDIQWLIILTIITILISLIGIPFYNEILASFLLSVIWIFSILGFILFFFGIVFKYIQIKELENEKRKIFMFDKTDEELKIKLKRIIEDLNFQEEERKQAKRILDNLENKQSQ